MSTGASLMSMMLIISLPVTSSAGPEALPGTSVALMVIVNNAGGGSFS